MKSTPQHKVYFWYSYSQSRIVGFNTAQFENGQRHTYTEISRSEKPSGKWNDYVLVYELEPNETYDVVYYGFKHREVRLNRFYEKDIVYKFKNFDLNRIKSKPYNNSQMNFWFSETHFNELKKDKKQPFKQFVSFGDNFVCKNLYTRMSSVIDTYEYIDAVLLGSTDNFNITIEE